MGVIKNMVIDRGEDETAIFLLDQDIAWTISNMHQMANDSKIPKYKRIEVLNRIKSAAWKLVEGLTEQR